MLIKKYLEDSNEHILCILVISLILNPCQVRTLFNTVMDEGMNKSIVGWMDERMDRGMINV